MAYTKPAGNNIQAVFQAGYVQHAGNSIQANFVSDIVVEIPEITFSLECSVDGVINGYIVDIPESVFTLECSVDGVSEEVEIHAITFTLEGSVDGVELDNIVVEIPEIVFTLGGSVAGVSEEVEIHEITFTLGGSVDDAVISIDVEIPEITFTLGGSVDGVSEEVAIPEITFNLSGSVAGVSEEVSIPEIVFTLECSVDDVLIYSLDDAIVQYYFNVTGTENGVSDVELPISSFQARRRNDAQTYLSVVVPSYDFISDIAARQNGKMQIYQGYIYEGELVYKKKIIETVISKVDDYQGGKNNSIVLTGYLSTYYSPKTLNLSGFAPTYKSNQGGKVRYRLAKPSIELNPGDTVIINSDSFVVDTMSYSINAKNQQIEISSI